MTYFPLRPPSHTHTFQTLRSAIRSTTVTSLHKHNDPGDGGLLVSFTGNLDWQNQQYGLKKIIAHAEI